ncbi:MAG: glycosyltransferase family 4 protein [Desulfobacterales bacterium]|jgi:glycosyltransferase involved in cell wall biosynthesis|nr:glycosyltransferase family 4 protein [Desulfobacterales bacterium]
MNWLATQEDTTTITKVSTFLKALFVAPCFIFKSDIIHIHTASNVSFYRKSIFVVLSKILKKKVVLHIHGGGFGEFLNKNYNKKRIIGCLITLSDKILCLSTTKANEITFPGISKKIAIVSNPCPSQTYSIQRDKRHGLKIIYAGWIEKEKGVFDLILAFKEVYQKFGGCKLILAGKGQIKEGEKIAIEQNVVDNVIFTGWLQRDDMNKAYSNADIFCLPSYCEGVPMSMLEAMAYGLPIITTPVGGIPDIIKHGENGLLFNPGDIHMLKNLMLQLISDQKLREKIGQNAKKYAQLNCSIPIIADKVSLIYKTLLEK